MKTRRLQGAVALALAITIALVAWKAANAYNICCSWSGDSAIYTYDLSLPGSFENGTWYGANVWTQVSTSSWVWVNSPNPGNLVKYGSLDGAGGTLAVTTLSLSGSTITGIEIEYDSAENWYTGSGTPAGNQVDLRSAAAHEFGHGLGLDHATPNEHCPGNQYDATMCQSFAAGTTHFRTLEADDRGGVSYLYP
jgi:hypothetical protein